jgi:hypothetical protein
MPLDFTSFGIALLLALGILPLVELVKLGQRVAAKKKQK